MPMSEHKFTIGFLLLLPVAVLHLFPVPLGSLVLLLYFPGVYLVSFMKKELDLVEGLVLPLLLGICFWVVFSYGASGLSLISRLSVGSISFFCSVLADKRHIHITTAGSRDLMVLLVCCAFMVSYSYPWSQSYQWSPPGDDMKYHAPLIERISQTHSLPGDYGELYPELTTLTYPLGYHALISLALFDEVSVSSMTLLTLWILPLACFSFYFLEKTLFNRRTGMYSAFSLAFLSLFFHRLLHTSTYPNLLGITIQVCAFFLLMEGMKNRSKSVLALSVLAFAASGEIHTYIFVLNGIMLSFLFCYFMAMREVEKGTLVTLVGIGTLLLSIPFLLRLGFQPLSPVEAQIFAEWYEADSIRSLTDLLSALSMLGPFLLIFGILGIYNLKRKKADYFLMAVAALAVIPLLSALQVRYPGWYMVSPNRFLFFLFIPLCLLCGNCFSTLEITLSKRKFLPLIIIILVLSGGMHHLNLFNSFLPDPIYEVQMNPDDALIIQYIADCTPPGATILNTGPAVDCSSWVPVLAKRRVLFPFFSGYRGDGCIKHLEPYDKLADMTILKNAPDSDLALELLRNHGVDYIYIPSWKKRPFLDLFPALLDVSPLYRPVVKQGNAYLFEVDYTAHPGKTYFSVQKGDILMENKMGVIQIDPQVSPDVQGSFFIRLDYRDAWYGNVTIIEDTTYIDTLYLYETGKEKSMMFPLSGSDHIELHLFADDNFSGTWDLLFGMEDALKIGGAIGLKGKGWITSNSGLVTAPASDSELRIYLFDISGGELVLTYLDAGYGNVDINVQDEQENWYAITTIFRENTGKEKMVRIPLDREYSIFIFGLFVYGDAFPIYEIQYLE